MLPTRDRVVEVLRALIHEIRTERVTFMAGSIAYHAFVSLLPLLLLVLAAINALGSTTLQAGLVALTEAVLTPGAGQALVTELRATNGTTGVSVLGGVLLVWGTLRIFRGLDTAFSDIYESSAANGFADQMLDGVVVLITVALAVVVGSLAETRLGGLSAIPGGWIVQRLVLVAGLTVVLFPMYYVFPDEEGMHPVEAVPGAVFAAVGLTSFQTLFRIYIAVSSRSPRQSLLAAILVFLTWLYFSGLVILVGAALNAVLTNRSVDVSLRPVVGGVRPSLSTGEFSDEDVIERLRLLDGYLAHADGLTIEVDGERIRLPTPTSVEVETDGSRLAFVDTPAQLRLAWAAPVEGDG
ncbi:MAG: YihY/virulence factor BrkB family protein [Haloferacaceae archaeon]